ncbi:programmed cell death 1 ligand 1-like [Poecilia latipinna]|uniref:programmed cell death 1 ligand 1-like n=1 Tax=Poecilia latipinna TaxID=48699 RepID=UPI00072E8DF9|nr:PREDICTED: programmed cell death 1 ligand 1-like [Poecilia latipinna]
MAEGTLTLLRLDLLSVSALVPCMTASGDQNLSVRSGGSVTLSCSAADLTDPEAVIWSRTDLDSDVLFVRPGQKNSLIRHQSYQNRANLLDWQVKNGEASLVLDNVTTDDSGTYECRVQIKEKEMKRISTVSLQVSAAPPPGNQNGSRNDGGNKSGSVRPFPAAVLLFVSLIHLFALRWVSTFFLLLFVFM